MNEIKDENKPLIHIFWTGGWDSSYRMVELSRQAVTVQPIYIYDQNRASNQRELTAIDTITKMLRERKETIAEILNVKKIALSDIPENSKISAAAKQLSTEFGMGSQHDWTARLAEQYPMVEMCIERVTTGYMPIRESIRKYGVLTKSSHGYVIDREKTQEVLNLVLGNITLPIFETTELDMRENIKQWGYEDVMKNIWFCHRPIDGKPCGFCSPCHTKIHSDMGFLLTEEGRKRYQKAEKIEARFGKLPAKAYRFAARKLKIV